MFWESEKHKSLGKEMEADAFVLEIDEGRRDVEDTNWSERATE